MEISYGGLCEDKAAIAIVPKELSFQTKLYLSDVHRESQKSLTLSNEDWSLLSLTGAEISG